MEKTHTQLWEDCLKICKDNLSLEQYKAWFEPIISKEFDGVKLCLKVPTAYFVEKLEEQYGRLLVLSTRKVYGPNVKIFYDYNQVGNDPATAISIESSRPSPAVHSPNISGNPFNTPIVEDFDSQLNPKYTFENYCSSPSNKIARSIGEAIAMNPECKTFNPFFVFGSAGVGKTHLIQAIGIRTKERDASARVLYVPARLFESQYTVAATSSRVNEFINFYQSIDVLIIDDIQDLMNKPGTQKAFFHIFNHLHQNQRQIILSSDCAPSEMRDMHERLLSRFKWGMTAQLERPDIELRREVLSQKVSQDGLVIAPEVMDYIVSNVTDSIRELEGIIVSLMAHATVLNRDITVDLAQSVINNAVKIHKKVINFEMIAQNVSDYYKIDVDQIFAKTRKREISDARQMIMYLARSQAKMPVTAIGTRLSRTHATVLHACKSIEERLTCESVLRDDVAKIKAMMAK